MNLDDTQRKIVSAWIEEGLTLSQIQNKLGSEFGLRLTYMEVRFLIDDLKLKPKDKEPPVELTAVGPNNKAGGGVPPASAKSPETNPPPAGEMVDGTESANGGVSLTVDQLARPGALVSGKVTFSDGKKAEWHLDQFGRLGLVPAQQGYRPSQQDLQEFQLSLQEELQRLGI